MSEAPTRTIAFGGETLELLPERALWWPAARTLFVADLHLGKAASFRALGQPVPHGTTADNLQRLGELVARHAARHLVVLGDLLHAAPARRPRQIEPLRQWREAHAALDFIAIRGNHDRHAGEPPPELRIRIVDEPWPLDASSPSLLSACHHPQRLPGRAVLAGHWHPAVALRGPARDRLRLPCFCLVDGDLLVLPSFGAFTGSSLREPPEGATCYPVADGRVWAGMSAAGT